jgi:hypothetical protein
MIGSTMIGSTMIGSTMIGSTMIGLLSPIAEVIAAAARIANARRLRPIAFGIQTIRFRLSSSVM